MESVEDDTPSSAWICLYVALQPQRAGAVAVRVPGAGPQAGMRGLHAGIAVDGAVNGPRRDPWQFLADLLGRQAASAQLMYAIRDRSDLSLEFDLGAGLGPRTGFDAALLRDSALKRLRESIHTSTVRMFSRLCVQSFDFHSSRGIRSLY